LLYRQNTTPSVTILLYRQSHIVVHSYKLFCTLSNIYLYNVLHNALCQWHMAVQRVKNYVQWVIYCSIFSHILLKFCLMLLYNPLQIAVLSFTNCCEAHIAVETVTISCTLVTTCLSQSNIAVLSFTYWYTVSHKML
jgi:hypothetical protein